ncbi:MAG: hypothetical protein LUE09_05115 [Synergistaceae bacterium]|nr:hypothetical protein [Synergistaceae bacterium]
MIVERAAGEYLIAGHGFLDKSGLVYNNTVVPNGIELVLFSLPGICSSVGLANAMVLGKKCRLKLNDIKTKKTIHNDYNPPVLGAGKFTPDYSIKKQRRSIMQAKISL